MVKQDGGGGQAEEAIRAFMMSLGYFAVRGIKFRFDGEEATDIDVWAYGPGSATHRERVVVDSKYKRQGAHGYERLFWLEGVRRFAYAEHAILATSDGREGLRSATARLGVRLIDPLLFATIIDTHSSSSRLSEEDFFGEVIPLEDKLLGKVRERYEASKSRLLRLDWDMLNLHLDDVRRHVEDAARRNDSFASIRLMHMSVAFALITLDFLLRDAAFVDQARLFDRINEGLRFGSRGRAGVLAMFDVLGRKNRNDVMRAAEALRADIPADYFSRIAGTPRLFEVARVLEGVAYARDPVSVADLPSEAQAVVGVVLDYLEIDRRAVFGIK